jgi:hypothetical protein
MYRRLLQLYPAEFRMRFSDDMVQLFGDQVRDARAADGSVGSAVTWLRALADLAIAAASEHARQNRTVAHTLARPPSRSSRLLGLLGILGGVVLLAAFLVEISPGLNNFRLMLFNAGAIAIVVAIHRRQASVAPGLLTLTALAAALANSAHLVATFVVASRIEPIGAGDLGLVYFYVGLAMWLTDAAFGLVALRLGVVARWGALALAIGSLLAILGMDRLGLTSPANPSIFGPVALIGVALNGVGWVALGIDLATRRRSSGAPHAAARPALREPPAPT